MEQSQKIPKGLTLKTIFEVESEADKDLRFLPFFCHTEYSILLIVFLISPALSTLSAHPSSSR